MKAGDPKSAARELQATWQRSVSGRGRAEAAERGSEVRAGTRGPWGEGKRGAGGRDGLTGRQTQRWGPPDGAKGCPPRSLLSSAGSWDLPAAWPPRRAMLLHEEPGAPAISTAETGTPPQVSSTSSLC